MQKTIMNLAKAFVGESQARNRYSIYAKVAQNEGYERIAALFLETAVQEKEHASWLFKMINGLKNRGAQNIEGLTVEADVPLAFGTTAENLQAAINGENYEHSSMYPQFADIADQEGLSDIAARLRAIAAAEANHERRYKYFLDQVANGKVFDRDEETEWECRQCGYTHKGKSAPKTCPSCGHPQSYYQEAGEWGSGIGK